MARRTWFRLAIGVCAGWMLAGGPARPAAAPPADVRALWVVRTTLTSRERVASMVQAAAGAGFNTLLVQVRGRGDAFYDAGIEPRSADLDGAPASFDPLGVTLELAHRAGLRVHAWIAVNLVASSAYLPAEPTHVVNRHPDWVMVPASLAATLRTTPPSSPAYLDAIARWTHARADQIEGLFLSPITPASRQYTVSVVRDLVTRYAVDGVHLDYVRYPGDEFDYSAASLAAFRSATLPSVAASERQRLDRAARTDPAAWTTAFPDAWTAFRRDRLTWLVHAIAGAVRSVRPHALLSAAVLPRSDDARLLRLQDWPHWASSGDLDVVCPMAYVSGAAEFAGLVDDARAAAGRARVWAGIGAFRLPAADAAEQVRIARRRGAAGVAIFSYDSATGPDASPGYLATVGSVFTERR